ERDPVHDHPGPAGPGGRGVPGHHAARRPRADPRPVGGRAVTVTAALIPAVVLAAPGAGVTGPGLAGSELAPAGVGQPFAPTVPGGPLLVAAAVSALVGLVSFLSPCVLPLVPGYLSYVTGLAGTEAATGRDSAGGGGTATGGQSGGAGDSAGGGV